MGARGHHGEGEEGSTCLPDTGAVSPGLSSGEKGPLEQACLLHLSPFLAILTPSWPQAGGRCPREGTVSGGVSRQQRACLQQPCNRGTLGELGSRGPGTRSTGRDFSLFHQLLQGEPPVLLPSCH